MSPLSRLRLRCGFTLIEVLVVIAVIAILGAILLSVRDGVGERARRSRAEGELASIGQALEQYRAAHGDYPWLGSGGDDAVRLARAVQGLDLPDGRPAREPRPFLDLAGFQWAEAATLEPVADAREAARPVLVDPWGQPYRYAFRRSAQDTGWQRRGYVLLSTGPSGALLAEEGVREDPAIPADGLLDETYFNSATESSPTHDNLLAQP